MDTPTSLAIVALAGLIHASFQLSVSVLSLMSSHTIGARRSHAKLLRMMTGFTAGAGIMTMLLFSFISLVALHSFGQSPTELAWIIGCGLLFGLGFAVWLFYYRHDKGTQLWLPRSLADYLNERSKHTRRSAEAFGLGLSSILAELLFIIVPIVIAVLATLHLPALWQLAAIGLYTLVSLLSLFVVGGLVGSGHTLSSIQRWREKHKYFLQFSAGSGLIILGFFVYVNQVMATASAAAAGSL